MVLLQWTGWNKNKNAGLRSHLLQQQHIGAITRSMLLTPQVTLTSRLKFQDHCVYQTVLSPCQTHKPGQSHKQKLFGDKPPSIKFQESCISIRWTRLVLILSALSKRSTTAQVLKHTLFSILLELKQISKVSLISLKEQRSSMMDQPTKQVSQPRYLHTSLTQLKRREKNSLKLLQISMKNS